MGARGPKPDAAQAAKGYPGRRKSKAVKAAEESARIAALLAPAVGIVTDLPSMLQDPKYAPAAALWRRLAPELRKTYRLPVESEFLFVQFCIYGQEWVESTEDLHTNGFSQKVKTVAGDKMERRRPKSFDRQQAHSNLLALSGKFGLTPDDMYALFKGQVAVAASHPDLFGGSRKPLEAEAPATGGRVGGMGAHRSAPPTH